METTQKASTSVPRFEARSPDFELVGVLEEGRLLLYLDRADDNAPVAGARLDVEGRGVAEPIGEGTYALPLAALPPGRHPVVVAVDTPETGDLLNGVLEVSGSGPVSVNAYFPVAAGVGLLIAAAAVWAWLRRRKGGGK